MGVYIIAEAGVNHNGRLDRALALCRAAKESGADAVKFQTWKTEKILTRNVAQADYQKENTGQQQSQFDMLKRLELTKDDFRRIKEFCGEIGITFASTADEEDSLDFLISLGIPFIKISSGEIGNLPYLRRIGEKRLPVILSTGMSGLAVIEESLHALRQGGAEDITLLHCTTNYPCPHESVNLKAMDTLKTAFGLPVGFSDHTMGMEAAVAAAARGARVIEKHLTLDRSMEGPDHAASIQPEEFKAMTEAIRNVEKLLGDGIKLPTGAEQEISRVVMKRIVANRHIVKGQRITENDICAKRNDTGIPVRYWDLIVGSEARKDYKTDEAISL